MPNQFGGHFQSTNLDLFLATLIAIGLPFATAELFDLTSGAAIPLLLYYGVCGVLIVRWRKGTLDFHRPSPWPWPSFLLCLLIPLAITANNWGALPQYESSVAGFLATLIGWTILNGAIEHLSWFYVLDAWRNRWQTGGLRWVGLLIGIALMLALIALIHAFFWVKFLPAADPTNVPAASFPLSLLLTGTYALLYYRSRSMWPTFIIHLLVNIQLIALSHYSILPAL